MASHEPRDFLLEIGTEELPAAFVQTGLSQLPMHMQRALEAARIDHGPMQAMGTPRRLALHIEAMAATQREERELRTGPPVQIAFAPDGRPTAAAQGFARQCGVTVDALRRVTKGKGEVVAAEVLHAGGPVCDVLALLVPEVCAQLHFAKTMRWGSGESAFARPVQWLVVRFGDAGIDCSFAGVKAGEHSFGHRFLHPGPVEISAPHAYVDALARAHVVVHPETRGAQMKAALDQAAADLGGHYDDDFLLSECRDLVETPHVVPGTFDAAFLRLPPALVVAVMRDHQRYFALFDDAGALLPHYLNVTNTAKAPDRIARGNDRVLHARLADARFFVDEDRKVPLETRAAGLDAVVFHAKLGSIGDKAKRIAHLLPALAQAARLDLDPALQARAARLCKADLLSLAVGEFPELQGVMGADYARAGGEDEAVAQAIEQHYWPRFAKDKLPNAPLAALLAVADRLDTLVGCLGVGLKPTGSADPFALRRIAHALVRLCAEGGLELDFPAAFGLAYDTFPAGQLQARETVLAAAQEFLRTRLASHWHERCGDTPLVDACLPPDWQGSISDLEARLLAVQALRQDAHLFTPLALTLKRIHNIASKAPDGPFDPARLEPGAERDLADAYTRLKPTFDAAVQARRYREALQTLAEQLQGPIHQFFVDVFVMVEDEALRANRLRLLAAIAALTRPIGALHTLAPKHSPQFTVEGEYAHPVDVG